MTMNLQPLYNQIQSYIPQCEQEERDRLIMLHFIEQNSDCLTRQNQIAHFTASAWVVNKTFDQVLMVYHNIYDSWSWTGGHADGDRDLLAVATKEAKEETGIKNLQLLLDRPCSLEIITVDGHTKKGNYVSSHLHMNLTYLFCASESETLTIKEDENSGVRWIKTEQLSDFVSEPWMLHHIYKKLLKIQKNLKIVFPECVDSNGGI